jgi:hypothetical protein
MLDLTSALLGFGLGGMLAVGAMSMSQWRDQRFTAVLLSLLYFGVLVAVGVVYGVI